MNKLGGVLGAVLLAGLLQADGHFEAEFARAQAEFSADHMVDAMMIYEQLAGEGYAPAHYELAYLNYKAGYFDTAWLSYQQAYDRGYSKAGLRLAEMILTRLAPETVQDADAVRYLETAAQANEVLAFMHLYDLFSKGTDDIAVNNEQAVHWLEQGAQTGEPQFPFKLGSIFENGLNGMAVDWPTAIDYYQIAAEKDYVPALNALIKIYETGNTEIPVNPVIAEQLRLQLDKINAQNDPS